MIDEISKVLTMLLYQVNQRLHEIFGYSDQLQFSGMSVIIFVDFFSNLQSDICQLIVVQCQ